MGNDGGSIAKRRDLTRHKKIKPKISCKAIQKAKANLCALSQEPLKPPILVCKLGFLYNKEVLLNALLTETLPDDFSHIGSLKDVIEAKFQVNASSLSCPVSGIEYNGTNNFFAMWTCGCVVSENALKEIPSPDCIMCSGPIALKVKINQTKDEQKASRKSLGIKMHKKNHEIVSTATAKIVDHDEIEKVHQNSLKSEVYKSLFSSNENQVDQETFCCRHLRAGLR